MHPDIDCCHWRSAIVVRCGFVEAQLCCRLMLEDSSGADVAVCENPVLLMLHGPLLGCSQLITTSHGDLMAEPITGDPHGPGMALAGPMRLQQSAVLKVFLDIGGDRTSQETMQLCDQLRPQKQGSFLELQRSDPKEDQRSPKESPLEQVGMKR